MDNNLASTVYHVAQNGYIMECLETERWEFISYAKYFLCTSVKLLNWASKFSKYMELFSFPTAVCSAKTRKSSDYLAGFATIKTALAACLPVTQ